jgi:hypothetical protein
MDESFNDIVQLIRSFQDRLQAHLPALESEIDDLINTQNRDESSIENTLDILLSLTMNGIGDKLFIKLLDYYKTINSKGADFYWNEYEMQDEDY